jgi:hypothetical protein
MKTKQPMPTSTGVRTAADKAGAEAHAGTEGAATAGRWVRAGARALAVPAGQVPAAPARLPCMRDHRGVEQVHRDMQVKGDKGEQKSSPKGQNKNLPSRRSRPKTQRAWRSPRLGLSKSYQSNESRAQPDSCSCAFGSGSHRRMWSTTRSKAPTKTMLRSPLQESLEVDEQFLNFEGQAHIRAQSKFPYRRTSTSQQLARVEGRMWHRKLTAACCAGTERAGFLGKARTRASTT